MDGSRLLCNSRPSPGRISRFAGLVHNPHKISSAQRSCVPLLRPFSRPDRVDASLPGGKLLLSETLILAMEAGNCRPKCAENRRRDHGSSRFDRLESTQLEKLKIRKASSVARLVRKVSPQNLRLTGHDR
ncbi:hypothetical protein KCU89_g67, partial [Aureobasidium melanogenum]